MERTAARTILAMVTGSVVLLAVAMGIASLGVGERSELDTFLRRSRGERVEMPLTPAQESYEFEVRRNGTPVTASLARIRGKVVFLNFWGTFCPPCIDELPSLLAMARSMRDKGVVVLAVSYDGSWQAIDKFFKEFTSDVLPDNFVLARDPETSGDRDMKTMFGTRKIPESYIIKGGRVVARFVNGRNWTDPDIVGLLEVLLRE